MQLPLDATNGAHPERMPELQNEVLEMKTISLLLLCAVSVGCAGSKPFSLQLTPTVAAQAIVPTSQNPDDFTDTLCASGCVYHESPGQYLALRLGPKPLNGTASFTYVLPYALKLRGMDSWIGTIAGSQLELDSRLRIKLPDGSWYEYFNEFDKHQDVRGEKQRYFPVTLTLPAGTKLTMYHTAGWLQSGSGDVMDEIWSFYAN